MKLNSKMKKNHYQEEKV